jgi:hypothetical protein
MKWYHWLIIGVVLTGGGAVVYQLTRGIRNNNPTNIRYNPNNNWKGQVGEDNAGFVKFSEVQYGIRAAGKVLDSYRRRGVLSIRGIIENWAPASENKTEDYIAFVVKKTGAATYHFQPARDEGDYPDLIKAIIEFENGFNPYSDQQIIDALNLA